MLNTAMLLAAGRGERLKPLTDHTPKALCRVGNIPLIEHHVYRLVQAGIQRIVINHAHLGGQIRQHLGQGERWGIEIIYSPEPPGGLETGGGLVQALPLLGTAPFLAINTDILTDYPFQTLTLPAQSLAHLVLVEKPAYLKQADFSVSAENYLQNTPKTHTYAGIACYHPLLFQTSTLGRYSVTPLLRAQIEHQKITGEIYSGQWADTGTIDQLHLANALFSQMSGDKLSI